MTEEEDETGITDDDETEKTELDDFLSTIKTIDEELDFTEDDEGLVLDDEDLFFDVSGF